MRKIKKRERKVRRAFCLLCVGIVGILSVDSVLAYSWDQKVVTQVYERAEPTPSAAGTLSKQKASEEKKEESGAASLAETAASLSATFVKISEKLAAYEAQLAQLSASMQSEQGSASQRDKIIYEKIEKVQKRIDKLRLAMLLTNKQLQSLQNTVQANELRLQSYKGAVSAVQWLTRDNLLYLKCLPFLLLIAVCSFFGWVMHLRSKQCVCRR